MRLKDRTISLESMHPAMWPMAQRVDKVYRDVIRCESTITSGSEVVLRRGKLIHKRTSLHYASNSADGMARAIDLRTWDSASSGRQLVGEKRAELVRKVAKAAGPQFQVIDERNHLHIELDG